MIATIFTIAVYGALATYATLISYVVWRVWRGENAVDRLIGVDLIGTLLAAMLVLVALLRANSIFIDVALGVTALGFIGVVGYARYAADQRMF